MSDVNTTAAPVAVDDAAPERTRNVLGQRPRTGTEERAAWVRRYNRWAKKALLAGATADDIAALHTGKASKAQADSDAGTAFARWHAKVVKVLGASEARAIARVAPKV